MIEKKLHNCYGFIQTAIAFNNYLNQEMYINTKIYGIPTTFYLKQYPKEAYYYTLISHAILLLSVFKEELLKKDEQDKLNLFISENTFDSLMGNLIQPDGTKYKLGSLTIDDKKEVLELIRNKLMHGDFYAENDSLYLVKEGITGEIKINDLIRTSLLLVGITDYKLKGKNTRPMVLCKNKVIESKDVLETDKDLKRFMNNVYFVEFYDEPENGFDRTPEYVLVLQKFYEELHKSYDLVHQRTFQSTITLLMHKYANEFKKHHVKLTYNIKPVSQTSEYSKIKKFFVTNKHEFDDLNLDEKKLYMVMACTNILDHQNSEHLKTSSAIYNNMKVLDAYLKEINPEQVVYNMQQSITFTDDMTVASLFNAFYSMYHYGLDEIYSNGNGTSLKSIVSGEYLNFAKLDLDKYYDPGMTIEATFADFPNQLLAIEKGELEAKAKMDKAEANLNNYLLYSKKQTKEKTEDMQSKFDIAKENYEKAVKLHKAAKLFMTNDFDRYVKNFNIISHIRNSFAHGNVRILPYVVGDPLLDQEILMQDIFKGKNTYTLRVKFSDLHELLEAPNAKIMTDFLLEKIYPVTKTTEHTYKLS